MVDFDLGPTSDLLAVTGALTLNGATLNVQEAGGLTSGTYEIMSYGSLPGGFNAGSLLVSSLPAGFSALVVNNPGANQIDLDIYAMKLWTGSHGSAWNTSTANWAIAGGTATFGNSDAVAFDDTASTAPKRHRHGCPDQHDGQQRLAAVHLLRQRAIAGSATSPSRAPARWPSTWRTTPTAAAPAWPAACSKSAPIARSPAAAGGRAARHRTADAQRRHLAGRRRRPHPGQRRDSERQRHPGQRGGGRPDLRPPGTFDAQHGDHRRAPTICVATPTTIADPISGGTLVKTAAAC